MGSEALFGCFPEAFRVAYRAIPMAQHQRSPVPTVRVVGTGTRRQGRGGLVDWVVATANLQPQIQRPVWRRGVDG